MKTLPDTHPRHSSIHLLFIRN
ncbi:hypothetical protein G871_03827, partial [Escherichia coli HVH 220 (4-5876842)]